MLLIGSHVNYNSKTQLLGATEDAVYYGATTFMFYTGAPQNTVRSKIDGINSIDFFNNNSKVQKFIKKNNIKNR